MKIMARRLLVPWVEGSRSDENAIEYGLQVAEQNGGELFVLSVLEFARNASMQSAANFLQHYCLEAKRRREHLNDLIGTFGVAPTRILYKWGAPVRNIVETARNYQVDLILMVDSRRRISLAESVMRNIQVRVLLLPGRQRRSLTMGDG